MNTEKLMPGIAVALLTEDREQSVVLNSRVESTNLARTVFSHVGLHVAHGVAQLFNSYGPKVFDRLILGGGVLAD